MMMRIWLRAAFISLVCLSAIAAAGSEVVVKAPAVECPAGTRLLFVGTTDGSAGQAGQRLVGVELAINNKVVCEGAPGSYSLIYHATEAGQFSVRIRGVFRNGDRAVLRKSSVTVCAPTGCRLSFLQPRLRDLSVLALVPKSRSFTPPISLRLKANGTEHAPIYLNPADCLYTCDLAGLGYGKVAFQAEAVVDGCHYVSPSYEVDRQYPIQLVTAPTKLDLEKNEKTLRLTVRLAGLEKATAIITADGEIAGETEIAEGISEITVDATGVPSKVYQIAVAVRHAERTFRTEPAPVEVSNAANDSRQFRKKLYYEKLDYADRLRNKLNMRRRILRSASSVLADRIGKPNGMRSVIRGLCVKSVGWLEFGKPMPIRLSVRPSKDGRASIRWGNRSVDLDTEISLLNALMFAQNYIGRYVQGFSVDHYDYSVTLGDEDVGVSGDSGGAALASLLISHFLDLPVRSDIAITGTVEPDGTVGPVGGYAEKSFAAFADPYVTTLVIPRTPQAIYESTLIAEFVATHRIIAASHMRQVLRHVLVTPDLKMSLCEGDWLKALAAYRSGQTDVALACLAAVHRAVPEDLTCQLWYDWLMEDSKLEGDISFNEKWAEDFKQKNPEVASAEDAGRFRVIGSERVAEAH